VDDKCGVTTAPVGLVGMFYPFKFLSQFNFNNRLWICDKLEFGWLSSANTVTTYQLESCSNFVLMMQFMLK
jgi:hypothetical protein